MKLTSESKVLLGILATTIVLVGAAALFLTKPAPTLSREDLIPSGAHTTGDPNAKTYLVEFSDFQCPACGAAQPIVQQVINAHKTDLLFVYRHFPLPQHPFAQQAAETSEAAAAQGKFWEVHDILFANQATFSKDFFTQLPQGAGLDASKFATALADPATRARVLDDQAAGNRVGVDATPTFFLNGKKLELASYDDLKTAVDAAVAQAK